jgi:hypothetical protein
VSSAVKSARKTNFNTRVLSVINRNIETKQKVINIYENAQIYGCGLLRPADASIVADPGLFRDNILADLHLQRGATQEQMLGNKIENCKLTIRGFVKSNEWHVDHNNSTLPFEVHMLAFKRKKSMDNHIDIIKQLPGNQTGPIDASIINSVYPFNKDSYVIKCHRVFRLRPLRLISHTSGVPAAGDVAINSQQSNAPMFQRFYQTIPISKMLNYSDGITAPSNDWLGLAFYVVNADGTLLTYGAGAGKAYQYRSAITLDAVLTWKDS